MSMLIQECVLNVEMNRPSRPTEKRFLSNATEKSSNEIGWFGPEEDTFSRLSNL